MVVTITPPPDTDRPASAGPETVDVDWAARRELLVAQHLPLVRSVAGKFAHRTATSAVVDFDDLVGFGCEGLLIAIDSFDAGLGYRFSTWAVLHIRTTIQDRLRALDPLGRRLRDTGRAIARAEQALAGAQGAWPTDDQVAAALGLPAARLREAKRALAMACVSLDRLAVADDDAPSRDRFADPDPAGDPQSALERQHARDLLGDAFAALPERDRRIAAAYYGQGRTMRAIARRMGLSESRVSQLHSQILKRLRIALAARGERPGVAIA